MLMNANEYLETVELVKQEIRTAQYRATVQVNGELLRLYHAIGTVINAHKVWGSKFVENLAADIKLSFPEMRGILPEISSIWQSSRCVFQLMKLCKHRLHKLLGMSPLGEQLREFWKSDLRFLSKCDKLFQEKPKVYGEGCGTL